jgi:hypothetical protein
VAHANERRRYPDRTGAAPSIPRIGALAATLLLHAGLLASLWAPAVDRPRHASRATATAADALRVRLLPSPTVVATHPRPTSSVTRRTHGARAGLPVAPSPLPAPPTSMPSPQVPVPRPIAAAPAPDYVPGSGRFAAPAYGTSNVRAPGHDGPARGAPTIAMADSRTRGAAGVVRFVGGLLGAVDPHCVDVHAWRGMTARERIAHHVDPDGIEATANRYGCAPLPVRPGSSVYWRDRH